MLMLRNCVLQVFHMLKYVLKTGPKYHQINLSTLLSFFSKCSVTHPIKSGNKISSTGMSDMLEVNSMLESFPSSWIYYKFMVLIVVLWKVQELSTSLDVTCGT